MKKYIFEVTVFILILIYFICAAVLFGVSNISLYNITLFLFASPLIEEYIFRGLVQNKINKFVNTGDMFYGSKMNKENKRACEKKSVNSANLSFL